MNFPRVFDSDIFNYILMSWADEEKGLKLSDPTEENRKRWENEMIKSQKLLKGLKKRDRIYLNKIT